MDKTPYQPAHKILVLIAYAQMPLLNTYDDVSSEARGLIFCSSLHLYPYFVYSSRDGSGVSVHMGFDPGQCS